MTRIHRIFALLSLPLLANCAATSASGPHDSLLADEVPSVVTESKSGDFLVDPTTKLAWSTRISIELGYSETKSYCASLGHDWRLPTVGELHSIFAKEGDSTTIRTAFRRGLPPVGVLFSSEEIPRIDNHKQPWTVGIKNGKSVAGHAQKGYARCVHGPKSRSQKPIPMPPTQLMGERWWEQDNACPTGSVARGTVGRLVSCQTPDGNTNGRSTVWTLQERNDTEYLNRTLHGKSVKWRADGLKTSEVMYREGELHGRSTFWHPNGEKASVSDYSNGKLSGKDIKWHTDGLKASDLGYREGQLHGRATYWHENGEKASESTFVSGKLSGVARKWSADGLETSSIGYRNGELHGKSTYWYPDGEKSSDSTFADGKLHGRSVKWRSDGIREFEAMYRNGQLHGTSTSWFANGEKASLSAFANGKKHGKTVKWQLDGLKVSEINYRNGQLNGTSTSYFANGEVSRELAFSSGLKHGVHQRWDEGGNLLERTRYTKARIVEQLHFDNGKLRDGQAETRHQNGVVSYAGVFKSGQAQGKHYGYHANGRQQFERNYNAKGILSGRSLDWHQNGKAREVSRYVQGALHGERSVFTASGTPKTSLRYKHGIPMQK